MSREKVQAMRSKLKWVNLMTSELNKHQYENQTHKFRRCVCPKCKREWPVPIYAEYTSCEDCHSREGSYVLRLKEYRMAVMVEEDGTRYPPGEARNVVAFHTGRWELGWWAQPCYATDVPDDWDGEYTPYPNPVAGWDNETGEEYLL